MTTAAQTRPVLVDTNVASYMLVRSGEQRALWSEHLLGRVLVIAVQTGVELLALPLTNNWGERKANRLVETLDGLPVVPVDVEVQQRYVALSAWGRRTGHAIGQPAQVADRWIAATALAHDLELATQDGHFDGIPDLKRLPAV